MMGILFVNLLLHALPRKRSKKLKESKFLGFLLSLVSNQVFVGFQIKFLCTWQLDRFIPNRAAMDFDYAHYMLTDARKGKENPAVNSPSRDAYRKKLAETFNMNRSRILAFKNKPPTTIDPIPQELLSSYNPQTKITKPRRHIRQV